jgi:hypothetical protein
VRAATAAGERSFASAACRARFVIYGRSALSPPGSVECRGPDLAEEDAMEMPKPAPGHEKLATLAGSWIGEERMHPSPWDPESGTATARIEARMAVDGFHLVSDYEQRRGDTVTYRGHAVHGYDPKTDEHWFYWFDSMGFDPESAARGRWEGNRLVYTHRTAMGVSRYSYEFEEDGHAFSIEMSPDGESFSPWLESRWRRE